MNDELMKRDILHAVQNKADELMKPVFRLPLGGLRGRYDMHVGNKSCDALYYHGTLH